MSQLDGSDVWGKRMDAIKFFRRVTGAAGVILLLYVLSYAPYLRARFGPDLPDILVPHFRQLDSASVPMYRPFEWMIDRTPMKKPLMAWARFWRVNNKTEEYSLRREFYRLSR